MAEAGSARTAAGPVTGVVPPQIKERTPPPPGALRGAIGGVAGKSGLALPDGRLRSADGGLRRIGWCRPFRGMPSPLRRIVPRRAGATCPFSPRPGPVRALVAALPRKRQPITHKTARFGRTAASINDKGASMKATDARVALTGASMKPTDTRVALTGASMKATDTRVALTGASMKPTDAFMNDIRAPMHAMDTPTTLSRTPDRHEKRPGSGVHSLIWGGTPPVTGPAAVRAEPASATRAAGRSASREPQNQGVGARPRARDRVQRPGRRDGSPKTIRPLRAAAARAAPRRARAPEGRRA